MKKFVIAGCGSRGYTMFAAPMFEDFKGRAIMCGVYDVNGLRAGYVSERCGNVPVFDDFEAMLDTTKPDCVIVATVDSTHHEYIIKALEMGYDVIVEKPMTMDVEKCNAIIEAEKRTGKKVTVTFNCRFMPIFSKIKELLANKVVGDVLSVSLEWMLDNSHGADYFRRWHKKLENSGGLLVHKATHHFDVVNWCIGDTPKTVSAFGKRLFYGPVREKRGVRCLTCSHQESCEFYLDINKDTSLKELYLDAEEADGYIRDGCVFADDIDIYDTMAVNVEYETGATLAYSLTAYSPYEGWRLSVTGTKGRLEAEDFHSGSRVSEPFGQIQVYHTGGDIVRYDVKKREGDHGGGDSLLRRMLFVGDKEDSLERMAGSFEGAKSLLIGACANVSIAQKRVVSIEDILNQYK